MKDFKIPKDIRMYILKRRIPYVLFFLALMGIVTFICISCQYIPPVGVVIGLIVSFIIFYNLPVFKNNLFDKTWAGEVVKIKDLTVELPVRGANRLVPYRKTSGTFLMFSIKNGDTTSNKIIRLPKNVPLNSIMDIYPIGSYILHIGCTKQYVVFKDDQKSYICPICGIENHINAIKCFDCGHTLIK
ncbi:MAG: hypothetical protein IKT46_03960 [Clostridia bacterium]|nr:hypothetical protein [Clostridia bacterium]